MPKIIEITNSNIASGTGKRGEWSQSLVKLDNGQEVRIFNPVSVGEEVESYQTESNGKTYTNYRKVKVETPQSTNQRIETNEINAKLDRILKGLAEIHRAVVKSDLSEEQWKQAVPELQDEQTIEEPF